MEGSGHAAYPTFEGRPNIGAILRDVLDYEAAPEVGVHSAGEAPTLSSLHDHTAQMPAAACTLQVCSQH